MPLKFAMAIVGYPFGHLHLTILSLKWKWISMCGNLIIVLLV